MFFSSADVALVFILGEDFVKQLQEIQKQTNKKRKKLETWINLIFKTEHMLLLESNRIYSFF